VGLDGLVADDQAVGDLRVGQAGRDEPQDLRLALGQLRDRPAARVVVARAPVALDQPPGELGQDERLARGGQADRPDELLGLGALEQEAARPGAQRLEDEVVVLERRQDEDLRAARGPGRPAAGSPRCRSSRAADVHQHEVGIVLEGRADGRVAVAGLGDTARPSSASSSTRRPERTSGSSSTTRMLVMRAAAAR
jgi:hypothetical protein